MSVVTLAERREAFYATFDEAVDLVLDGHIEAAQHSLERSLSKEEATVVHEAICTFHATRVRETLIAHGGTPEELGEMR